MKKIAYLFMSIAMVAMVSCGKEGEQGPAGPAGPAGAAGPAGENANFEVNVFPLTAAEWAGGQYIELDAPYITEEVFNDGVAIAYIKDSFGYWNGIPSQWHSVTGFTYLYGDNGSGTVGGYIGFDAVNGAPTDDYEVRVVTLRRADYDALDAQGLTADYNAVMAYLNGKK
jgi:hypothetical protein